MIDLLTIKRHLKLYKTNFVKYFCNLRQHTKGFSKLNQKFIGNKKIKNFNFYLVTHNLQNIEKTCPIQLTLQIMLSNTILVFVIFLREFLGDLSPYQFLIKIENKCGTRVLFQLFLMLKYFRLHQDQKKVKRALLDQSPSQKKKHPLFSFPKKGEKSVKKGWSNSHDLRPYYSRRSSLLLKDLPKTVLDLQL